MAMTLAAERVRPKQDGLYEGAAVVGLLVAAMWIVEIVNSLDGQRLDGDGIISRRLSGLPGIFSAPFLHAGFGHLLSNTVPFIVLGLVIAMSGPAQVIIVTVVAALTSGLGAWALSSTGTDTIGASGVVFGYATFLIARGFFARSMLQIAVGLLVAILFGGALVLSIVPQPGVSWQDHVFGAVGGVLAAWLLNRRRRLAAPENK
jgi:membrane associated rhomboid family serine protease